MSRRFDALMDVNRRLIDIAGSWEAMNGPARDMVLPAIERDYAIDVLQWKVTMTSDWSGVEFWRPPGKPEFRGSPPEWTRSVDAAMDLVQFHWPRLQHFAVSCGKDICWAAALTVPKKDVFKLTHVLDYPTAAMAVFALVVRKQIENYEDI